jgi:hypothetical protein
MLSLALKAKIPIIGIHTDDLVNVKEVVQSIAQKKFQPFPVAPTAQNGIDDKIVWGIQDEKLLTIDVYKKLQNVGASAIIVNLEKKHHLVFDAGVLETPESFLVDYLSFAESDKLKPILQALNGLSLKTASEIVQLSMARSGELSPKEIRRTKIQLGGNIPGLHSMDTDYDFYVMPKVLQEWIDLNGKYFLDPATPQKLIPRGLLLNGSSGTGKTMAAKVIAKTLDIPLFRLDISSSLNRFLGESESRIARNLEMIEASSPAVLILDEVEKQFGSSGDDGTASRILSQFLWFLQEHKSRVLTIMTSNDISNLPEELYRPGRIDKVMEIQKLSLVEAKTFAAGVYQNVIGKQISVKRNKLLRDTLDKMSLSFFSHAEITELVYTLVKDREWLKAEDDTK